MDKGLVKTTGGGQINIKQTPHKQKIGTDENTEENKH